MIAIVLASGRGTRLRPLTDDTPKPLVAAGEQPLLGYQFDALRAVGIDRCVVTTGPHAAQLRDYGTAYEGLDVEFVHNDRYDETNYGYSLWLAGAHLADAEEDVVLLHGDLVFEPSVLEALLGSPAEDAVVVDDDPDPVMKDFCARIEDGRVLEIDTHASWAGARQLYPIYRLSKETFDAWLDGIEAMLDRGDEAEYAEVALNERLDDRHLEAVPIDEFCAEVDDRDDLETVERWLATREGD